ncbi:MAG: hypothetical protein H0T20_09370 [Actinobacteria bacterium]|nr:hypothetical protein [Actinomycetota bacterium]
MKNRWPVVLSVTALVVAVLGATPVGEAALNALPRNSVGPLQLKTNAVTSVKVKNGSLLRADFRAGQIPAGAAGPAGPAGAQGAPGTSGLQTVFTTSPINSSTTRTLTATCPSGKVALGGGVAVTPTTATEVAITASYLANSTTWTASAQEVNTQAVSWGLNVVVICALVAP